MLKEWFFPPIEDAQEAMKIAHFGVWPALLVAILTVFFAMTGIAAWEWLWSLTGASVFVLIALGIHLMSRAAALAGLFFLVFMQMNIWLIGQPGNMLVFAVLFILFINSVRGTFAYHQFVKRGTAKQ